MMNKFKSIVLGIAFFSTILGLSAQEKSFEDQVKSISAEITEITEREKEALKVEVAQINSQKEAGTLTESQAEDLKIRAAERSADLIGEQVAIEEAKLQTLVQAKANGEIQYFEVPEEELNIGKLKISTSWDWESDEEEEEEEYYYDNKYKKTHGMRSSSQFVFAFGTNNTLVDHRLSSLDNSTYNIGSLFFELGGSRTSRIAENWSVGYFKYGFSVLWNNLRPKNNNYFEIDGNQTNLVPYPKQLKTSARLRNIEIVFPLHLEFDFSKPTYREDYKLFRKNKGFRLGMGGYGGFRFQTKQFIKYYENDLKYKEKSKGGYNVSNFIYGLSAYAGFKSTSLYVKYDLNPLFANTEERNISLGLRFDFE